MSSDADVPRELSGLVVPRRGSLVATGELFEPYRLVDGDGAVVVPAAGFFAELAACGRPATTQRSYGMDFVVPPKSWRVSYAASGLVLDSLVS